jgi:hypothetical protein
MSAIGKIERVPLREVWPHEARDLTTWLEEKVDVLNDAPGLGLVSEEYRNPPHADSPGRRRRCYAPSSSLVVARGA